MKTFILVLLALLLISCKSEVRTFEITYMNGDKDLIKIYGDVQVTEGCIYGMSSSETICGVRKVREITKKP